MGIRLVIDKGKFKNCTLITGFHGYGQTGYIATSFLVHALGAKRIGYVEVDHPPPFVATSEKGLITPFEIYGKEKLVVVKLEFSPHRTEEAEFAKVLASWSIEEKFKQAILIGGLDSSLKTSEHQLRIVPTQAYLAKQRNLNAPALEPGLFIFGPLAIMLSEYEMRNFPAVAILPYASPDIADPRAAAIAIRYVSKAHKLNVDVSQLEKDARQIEVEVEGKITQAKKSLQGMYA